MTSKRTTVVCKDLDEMIDLVQAWREGRFEAVRDAIRNQRKEQDMPEQQYSNDNQLGLWKVDAEGRSGYYNGYGEVGGNKVFDAYIIVNHRKGKGAFAALFYRTESGWAGVDIWNNDGKLGGSTDEMWVNVFKNEVEPGSKRPHLSVKFKAKEPVGAAASSSKPASDGGGEADGDLPF